MITNEEWDAIEKKLEGWFSDVSFLYDGHSVRVKKLPVSENNLRLIVLVRQFRKVEGLILEQDKKEA